MKTQKIFFLIFFLCPSFIFGQSAQDSLMQFLGENQSTLKSLVDNYKKLSFNWAQLLTTLAGVIIIAGLTWKFWVKGKLTEYVRRRSQEAIENMNNLKSENILVLSNKKSNDDFLRSFFKEKKFLNVRYLKIDNEVIKPKDFEYALVFVNNEDGEIDQNLIRSYLNEEIALFYFGKSGSWDYKKDTSHISRTINYANSRAQIYGNLMSSLEFLDLVKPKIKNV